MAIVLNNLFKSTIIKLLTAGSQLDYNQAVKELTLAEAINKIDRFFGCDRFFKEYNSAMATSYYTQSEWGYKMFHSQEDAIHMALNPDGVFNPDGYYTQPRVVAEQISKIDTKAVLELGCGKGFNSYFLSGQYPGVNFIGIDLTPLHIKIAHRKAQGVANLTFQAGDFNQLSFPDRSFDVVFAFECLCHANQIELPIKEVYRVLRPGGRFIVFDGYRKTQFNQMPKLLQTATLLTEYSMAINHGFAEIDNWMAIAKTVGFKVQNMEDITIAMRPNLLRLQKLSMRFFGLSWKAKLIAYLLPKYLIANSINALLMPFTFDPEIGSLGYYKLILER